MKNGSTKNGLWRLSDSTKFIISIGVVLLIFFLIVILSGCNGGLCPILQAKQRSTVPSSPLLVASPASELSETAPADVKLFIADVHCPENFVPIVVFWGRGMDLSGEGRVLRNLKVKAAKLGANGLVLSYEAMLNIGALPIEGIIPDDQNWAVMAIRFKPEPVLNLSR